MVDDGLTEASIQSNGCFAEVFHLQPYCFASSTSVFLYAVVLLAFFLSGLPALTLLAVFHHAQIASALGMAAVSDKALLTFFYCFSVGCSLPTLLVLMASGFVSGQRGLTLELSKDGIRQIPDKGISVGYLTVQIMELLAWTNRMFRGQVGRFTDAELDLQLMKTSGGSLPFKRPIPWDNVTLITYTPGLFETITVKFLLAGDPTEQRWAAIDPSTLTLEERDRLLARLKESVTPDRMMKGALGSDEVSGKERHKPASYTDIWFSQISTAAGRERRADLLAPGIELKGSKYKVQRVLSRGGLANIYLAHSQDTDSGVKEDVVLKEFIVSSVDNETIFSECCESFDNERSILEKLSYPGVVKLQDYFVEDFRAYLVLEYVRGVTLEEFVIANRRVSTKQVVDLAMQMSDILKYLHGLAPPVIHRDFTPHNLLIDERYQLKLVDFNAALHSYRKPGEKDDVIGKPNFIPPEQFRGRATHQSDIYALGATMFFLLTGEEPTPISESHPRKQVPELPENIDRIVGRATALSVIARYQDIDEFLADLLLVG